MPDADPDRRRRRRRATAQQGPPADTTPPTKNPAPAKPARTREGKGRNRTDAGRGDRDLAGTATSQVGPTGAMRARDLNRPTAEDLAEAEAELTIVRRHWSANTDAPPSPRPARRRS